MLLTQLSYLPLLPFLEHHPHPAFLLSDDWFAPRSATASAGGALWLNEAAKVLDLTAANWTEVGSVVRRATQQGERHASDKLGNVFSVAASDVSSDGTSTPTVRTHPPDAGRAPPPPSSTTVLAGRFTTLLINMPTTNHRLLQLVPTLFGPLSPGSASELAPRVASPAGSSPSPSLSSLVSSPFSTASFAEPFPTADSAAELSSSSSSGGEQSPTSELPSQPVLDAQHVVPRGLVFDESVPRGPSPEEEDQRRRETYRMSEMLETFDWSTTALGPKADWPQSLKTIISVVMATATESCLWWGPDLNLIYNDAYAKLSMKKHPALFGMPAATGWSEIWDGLRDIAMSVIHDDKSIHKYDDLLFMQRDESGLPEETWFSWSWCGVKDESGKNGGMLNRAWETTTKVLAERRLLTLRELAQSTFACDTIPAFSQAVISSLKSNPHDLPFALLYVAKDAASGPSTSRQTQQLDLVGTIGVPDGHPSAPSELLVSVGSSTSVFGSVSGRGSLSAPAGVNGGPLTFTRKGSTTSEASQPMSGSNGGSSAGSGVTVTGIDGTPCPWPVELALRTGKPVLVEDCASLTAGFESRSWGELPSRALVIPVENEDSSHARCLVLVVGLNTRRPLDAEYDSWLRLVRLSLSSGLSGVASLEAQKLRAEELARLDRAKTTFFSNVSHELRTPLSLCAGPVRDLLATYTTDSPERRLLSIADRNVQRLTRLVDMLMDVSRVEAGRMQGTFSPRQVGQVTADLASLFRSAIEKAGLKLIVECDVEDARPVYIDPDLWEKIVFNIIGNAFKYTLEGSIRVWVRYLANEVEFGVQDSGVGIPAADVPLVVERFHRVASTGRSFEGTGIGLSLTVELIKVHGSTLEIKSQTKEESADGSHGSAFIVRMPLGSAHLPADRIDESAAPAGASFSRAVHSFVEETKTWAGEDAQSAMAETASSFSNLVSDSEQSSSNDSSSKIDPSTLFWSREDTILIVDDNADIRQYLLSILSPYCKILAARNGQEAYEIAVRSMPNLIVSDVMMPVLDGFGLIRQLKASQTEAAMIPVVIITARAGEDEKVGGLLDGADDYLPKPFSSKELIARCHLQMQMGKKRIDLERRFAARTLELQVRAVEAEAKRKEAEEQRRQQELLVDVTSHELRNPVSAILQNAQLVGENLRFLCSELQTALKASTGFQPTTSLVSMIEEDIEACESILMMGQSQERIANDVLSLARIQLSTLEIFPVPLDLIAETKRICSVFASECRLKRIHLSLVHGPSLQSLHAMGFKRIQADTGRLAQVLINLLSNAIRFTSPAPVREITVSIEVRKDPPDDDTCLPPPSTARSLPFANDDGADEEVFIYGSVADSGPGLTQEELSRLFQRFRQASAQTHVVFGGSGLGLYVCRKLLELQDGGIEVVSRGHAAGSTFRFFFRASLAPAPPPEPLSPHAAADVKSPLSEADRASKALSPSLPSVTGMRVLIVEDNVINQKVLDRQLRKAGIVADIASDGAEALDKIDASIAADDKYRVVLMDLEMPVLNGIGAIKRIRTYEADGAYGGYRHTVMALTGNARQGQIDAALAAGMDDVILKPYKIDQLLGKLRNVLQLNR